MHRTENNDALNSYYYEFFVAEFWLNLILRRYYFWLHRSNANEKVAKQPEGLDFHNRRSSTCGSNLSNNCLKGRTDT
jgi:hypothetical protein